MIVSSNQPHCSLVWSVRIAIVAAIVACFGQTAHFDFVAFDDAPFLLENPYVRSGLSLKAVAWSFSMNTPTGWNPLAWVSHVADWSIFGDWAGGHHLVNVMLHAIGALLLFQLLLRSTNKFWCSTAIAMLLAVHPLHVESVAWIAERRDVLSLVFAMLTLHAYLNYVARPSWRTYVGLTVCLALALMSKPTTVTLPCVLLLFDVWPLGRCRFDQPATWCRPIVEKLPLLILAIGAAWLTWRVQSRIGAVKDIWPWPSRLANAVVSYGVYLGRAVYPIELACFYPMRAWGPMQVAIASAVLAGISSLAVYFRRGMPWLLVGWLWYLGMLVPVIGLVQAGLQARADRYTYLPMIGIYIAVVMPVARWCESSRSRRRAAAVLAVVVVGLLGAACFAQVGSWRNSTALYTHALDVSEGNYLAHTGLGAVLSSSNRPEDIALACEHFQKAIDINPDYLLASFNLARVLVGQKRFAEALVIYSRIIDQHPDRPEAYLDLGNVLAETGDHEAAVASFRTAIDRGVTLAQGHYHLALSLLALDHRDEAIAELHQATRLKPEWISPWYKLATLEHDAGDLPSAAAAYRRVIALDDSDLPAHYRLGQALFALRDLEGAKAEFKRTIQLDPTHAGSHHFLGLVCVAQSLPEEAIPYYRRALALRPDWARACNDLGVAYAMIGHMAEAIRMFDQAVKFDPDFQDAKANLAKARQ